MDKNAAETDSYPVFHKVGQNLYRLESSGIYYALFKRGGKQIRRSLKTNDRALAQRRLNDEREKIVRLTDTKGASKITFKELADRWLGALRVNLKPKSASRLEVCVKGLEPFFRGLGVRNLTTRHCEDWLKKRGKEISASSYKHERRTLIAIFDYAVRDGLILENPARRGEIPTRRIPRSQLVIPTREQFRLMVQTIRQSDCRAHTAGNLVELLGYSGMRLNEAVSLTWRDINWERGIFTVTGGKQGTKNHEVRTVPLFPAMRELLERVKEHEDPAATERVIPFEGPNGAATAIRNAIKKAGLPHFTPHHSLRHYFISNAVEAGIDFKVIAEWVGHKDGGYLIAKLYSHLRNSHSFEMARRMTFSAVTDERPANLVTLPPASDANP